MTPKAPDPSGLSTDSRPLASEEPEPTEAEQKIFEAALGVFARKGRDGARMQEIADAAGVNKAMLHYYFRSKDRLYARVFHHVFGLFGRAFSEAVEEAGERSFALALRSFIDHYVSFVAEHEEVLRLMVNEFLEGGAVIRAEMGALLDRGSAPPQRFAALIARAMERGEIRPMDPRQVMLTIISGCLFPFVALPMVETILPEAREDFDAFLAVRRRHLFEVLYRGLALAVPAGFPDTLPEPEAP